MPDPGLRAPTTSTWPGLHALSVWQHCRSLRETWPLGPSGGGAILPTHPMEVLEASFTAWEFRNKGPSQQSPPFKGIAGFLCHMREREADVLVGGEGRGRAALHEACATSANRQTGSSSLAHGHRHPPSHRPTSPQPPRKYGAFWIQLGPRLMMLGVPLPLAGPHTPCLYKRSLGLNHLECPSSSNCP